MSGNMTEALRRIKKNKETKSRVLDMSGLWLTELPEELWECVWVEELGLGRKYWNIEKEEWEWDFENKEYVNFLPSVPSKLHRLENLTTLILDGINIPEINFVVNLPNIKSLDISFNQYNDVSFLAQLPNLQNLDFSYNYISDISILNQLPSLQYLNLGNINTKDFNALKGLPNLRYLNLKGNCIGDESFLHKLPNVQCLNLSDTKIRDFSFLHKLPNLRDLDLQFSQINDLNFLNQMPNLQRLNMSGCSISELDLSKVQPNLQYLDLNHNEISNVSFLTKFPNLKGLDLNMNQIRDVGILNHLPNLQEVDLHYNQISSLILKRQLPNLQSLNLDGNRISNFHFLGKLTNLRSLTLGSNQIKNIHFSSQLPNLRQLSLSNNQIKDFSFFKQMPNLENLDLGHNQISEFRFKEKLYNLQKLNLNGNQISDVNFLDQLPNLENLELMENQISNFVFSGQLRNLQSLNLSDNQIGDFRFLEKLTNLKNLSLVANRINNIGFLGNLTSLLSLNLYHNYISDLSFLGRIPNLERLFLNDNQVKDVNILDRLPNLQILNISQNQIREINLENQLIKLNTLSLNKNQIISFDFLNQLPNLQELKLDENGLSNFMPGVQLPNLQKLTLKDNEIEDISFLDKLPNLLELNLHNNKVSDINSIKKAPSLREIFLGHNQVKGIRFMHKLRYLQTLALQNNQIIDIIPLPKELGNIQQLSIGENNFMYFPFELLFLPKLFWLNIRKTSAINIPKELTHESNALPHLKNYYADLLKDPYSAYEAKQIIVGNGRVGKTSLLKALYGLGDFDPNEDSTHGIQLFDTTLSLPEKQATANLSLWDFGGQELYHATHRIFMQTRALYLVVWDPKTEAKLGEENVKLHGQDYIFRNYPLSYWLGNVRALSKDAKIIVICNKVDDGQERFPKDIHELQTQYNIDSYISVSAETGYGIPILRQRIQYLLEEMPEMGMQMPGSWRRVREKLTDLRSRQQCISLEEYHAVCDTEALSEGSMDTLLRFLHHSGFLFWHERYLRDQIILDQKWALEAIYQLLDRNGWYPLLKGNALRQRSELAKCWRDYTLSQVKLFLEMMQSCELALMLEDEESENPHYLIPEFLPDTPSPAVADIWEATTGPIYYFRFQQSFFHAALIQRFIVRNAKLAEHYDLFWRSGLLLKVESTLALVQVYPEAGRIDMQLRGTNPDYLLERLKNEITKIQELKDESGFLLSLTGHTNEWVILEQVKQQIKKGKAHIASTTGEILELDPFYLLLSTKNQDWDYYENTLGLKELSDRETGIQLLIPTAPPNPLEGLKLLVKKELINEGIGAAITCLETHLHTDSTPATDLIVISSQFQAFNRSVAKGLHSVDEQYLLSNRISNQVVALLTTIQEADLK